MSDRDVAIGVDLGGTKIEAVVLDRASGDVLARERVPTHRDRGYDAIVDATSDLVTSIARGVGLAVKETPIGVGMPGSVSRRTGLVKNSNTVCLNGRPFREDLSRRVGRPIAFENDANCFAIAEVKLGAARPYADGVVFGVIMGSGVGGGVVWRGQVWSGLQNIAGEWGHHAIASAALEDRATCYCGQRRCLELYLGGPFIEADYARRANEQRPLAEIAARRGSDHAADDALEQAVEAFGRAVANIIDILDPTAIVLGGGVSNLDLFYAEGRKRVENYVFNDELATPILRHELGDSAGVLGAAWLDGDGS